MTATSTDFGTAESYPEVSSEPELSASDKKELL